MLMFIGFILIVVGVVITMLVGEICDECNKHQLWKGKLEHNLALLDRIGLCVVGVGFVCITLG